MVRAVPCQCSRHHYAAMLCATNRTFATSAWLHLSRLPGIWPQNTCRMSAGVDFLPERVCMLLLIAPASMWDSIADESMRGEVLTLLDTSAHTIVAIEAEYMQVGLGDAGVGGCLGEGGRHFDIYNLHGFLRGRRRGIEAEHMQVGRTHCNTI